MTHHSPIAVQHSRRNWLAFFSDYVFFGLCITFASTSTTLPAFAAALTNNKILIGAVSSVWLGGWLLPQVLIANFLSNKPRKYPILIRAALIGRPIFPLFTLWLLLGGAHFTQLTLFLFLGTLAFFTMWDAVAGLAWFDLMGKSLAPETRGRMIGVGQALIGLLAIGAGVGIRYLLGEHGPPFPLNYAIIFGLASLCFWLSFVGCAFIVEPPEAVIEARPSLRNYLPELVQLWREDAAFSRVMLVRLLSGLGGLAISFYVVYGIEAQHLPASSVGLFAGANTVGVAIAGIVLGLVADRWGSQRVVQITNWLAFSVPALALVMSTGLFGHSLPWIYPGLYVLMGIFDGSVMLGYFNFILEIAPIGRRPVYIGLANTLTGILVVVPVLGGFILSQTSYPILFALAAAGTLAAALASINLPNPRKQNLPPAPEISPQVSPGL